MTAQKTWIFRPIDERYVATVRQKFGVSDFLARFLSARAIPLEDVPSFLNPKIRDLLPDPSRLLDMSKAATRTAQALKNGEAITIYGDYDVDGATSVALLLRYFEALGYPATFYIPDRLSEGYGVNVAAVEELASKGTNLLIMVDCGTGSVTEIERAQALGMDTLVLDHHIAGSKLPPATAIVNAFRLDQPPVPFIQDLCSAGLVFLFLVELQRQLRTVDPEKALAAPNLMDFCDFVALGTVCDVMPLRGLNRAFVQRGLEVLARRTNCGLRALMDAAAITDHPSAHHLGFVLGPRINAGGRIGTSRLGTELLTTADDLRAKELSITLNHLNAERQALERQTVDEALQQIEAKGLGHHPVLLVGADTWHPGVIGIAASRLKEAFARPVFIAAFQEDEAKGSARSVEGLDVGTLIHTALQKGILKGGGGHAMAGGFTVERAKFEAFRTFLNDQAGAFMAAYKPELKIDAELSLGGATVDLLKELDRLEPFGAGNARPYFCFRHVRIRSARAVGAGHVQCVLEDGRGGSLRAIAFRCQETPLGDLLSAPDRRPLSVVGTLDRNIWQGQTRLQLILEDACEGNG